LKRSGKIQLIPPILYKYVGPARVDILSGERVSFTPPDQFNDVIDIRPVVKPVTDRRFLRAHARRAEKAFVRSLPRLQRSHVKMQLRELRTGAVDHFCAHAADFAQSLQEDLQGIISKKFGVLCLSETFEAELMWAHYAQNHKGFVIALDTASAEFKRFGVAAKVQYLPEPPVYDPLQGSKGFWYQKKAEWNYEREWRISRLLSQCEKVRKGETDVYLCPLSRQSVVAVYLGVKSSVSLEQNVRSLMANTRASIYRGRIKPSHVGLAFDRLS
jgi:hypothetical protein